MVQIHFNNEQNQAPTEGSEKETETKRCRRKEDVKKGRFSMGKKLMTTRSSGEAEKSPFKCVLDTSNTEHYPGGQSLNAGILTLRLLIWDTEIGCYMRETFIHFLNSNPG
jgi:hypothetical protein